MIRMDTLLILSIKAAIFYEETVIIFVCLVINYSSSFSDNKLATILSFLV